jgi:nucleoside-diphosphate-sugar epimerase
MRAEAPILVTGAGGFIGGRVVEVLHGLDLGPVRAGVRRWSSAVRVGRFPVEIMKCDVTNRAQVESAVAGAGSIVHCAYGPPETTIQGTRNVLEAATRHGTPRVVHLSSMEVYGDAVGDIDETFPLTETGRPYGDSKIAAERLCGEFMDRGCGVVILRPTVVYGPFSRNWTVDIAQRLIRRGIFPPEEDCGGYSNLVYVDDLVATVLLALREDAALGEAFNVNSSERVTWLEYLHTLNSALELPPISRRRPSLTRARSRLMMPVRSAAGLAYRQFQGPIMNLYKRSDLVKRGLRSVEASIRSTPPEGEFRLYRRRAFFPPNKALRLLGYEPRFSMREGVELSAAWLRHHGFLDA